MSGGNEHLTYDQELFEVDKEQFNSELKLLFEMINTVPLDVALPAEACRLIKINLRKMWADRIGLAFSSILVDLKENNQITALREFMRFDNLIQLQSAEEIDDFTKERLKSGMQEIKQLLAENKTLSDANDRIYLKNKIKVYRAVIKALKAGTRELKAYSKAVKQLDSIASSEDIAVSTGSAVQDKHNVRGDIFPRAGAVLSGTLSSLLSASGKSTIKIAISPVVGVMSGVTAARKAVDVAVNEAKVAEHNKMKDRGLNGSQIYDAMLSSEYKRKLRNAKLKGLIAAPIMFGTGLVVGTVGQLGFAIESTSSDMKDDYKRITNKVYANKLRLIARLTALEGMSYLGDYRPSTYKRYMKHIQENIDKHKSTTSNQRP